MARQFSKEVERAAFFRCHGHCQGCDAKLASGGINYDHVVPWAMSFDSSLGNCQVLCNGCDRDKTFGRDLPRIAKAKRQSDFHHGITGPGLGPSPMPCGRRDRHGNPGKWRKTLRHGVVPRLTHAEKHRALMAKLYPEGNP